MGVYERVQADLRGMARYWQLRKFQYLDRASEEFALLVDPEPFGGAEAAPSDIMLMNVCFTEWLLLERCLRDGKTPLELYVAARPVHAGARSIERLGQVARTQLFSRFDILDRDRAAGVTVLRDTFTGRRHDVADPRLLETERWREGVIGMRIAQVDGAWVHAGVTHLYDVAPSAKTRGQGPGEVPVEGELWPALGDMTLFLRILRDVLGAEGRFRDTARTVTA